MLFESNVAREMDGSTVGFGPALSLKVLREYFCIDLMSRNAILLQYLTRHTLNTLKIIIDVDDSVLLVLYDTWCLVPYAPLLHIVR